ncbi:ATP-binding protein [Actinomadura barringtoniae]|uniref:ATP-binding protein n=1 Tax=Actinomadura barringtoniae TaxID=1427535 RepID=A0A939PHL3_9ACTN|nr:ATP-binding protein [Actinomadura barringtoniae]MBO2448696.1 ATP-binding protein [Actinomadura barringtoniae]
MLRNPQLEALFGVGRLDQVSHAEVLALVGNTVAAESAVLDYKQQVHAKNPTQKAEFCKDVAAMANYQGGVLLLGVAENAGAATAQSVPGVDISDGEIRRLRQTAQSQVSPYLDFDLYPLPDGPGSLHGVLMVAVARSARAPHAVSESPQPGLLGYPVRDGAQTRWMSEPEIFTRYRQRDQAIADRAARTEDVEVDAVTAVYESDVQRTGQQRTSRPLMVLSLVPEQPGDLRITPAALAEATQALTGGQDVQLGDVGVASARFIAADTRLHDHQAPPLGTYMELHTDGAGSFVAALDTAGQDQAPIELEQLTVDIIRTVALLARHARDRVGASGVANLRLQLLASPDCLQTSSPLMLNAMGLTESTLMIVSTPSHQRISLRAPTTAVGRAQALLDSLVDDGAALAAAAALAIEEALQAFGLVELELVTPAGALPASRWRGHDADAVRRLAAPYGIPVV